MNEWHDHPIHHHTYSFSGEAIFSTEDFVEGTPIEVEEAEGWRNLKPGVSYLEAELRWRFRYPKYTMAPLTWYLLLEADGAGRFTTAHVCETRDAAQPLATLRRGEWSPSVVRPLQSEELGAQDAVFRLKLLDLSNDGERVTLYATPLCQVAGWSFPDDLAAEIHAEGNCRGLPAPYLGLRTFRMGWFDAATFVELCDMHHQWLADASSYVMQTKPWDLYFGHIHTPDSFYHLFASQVDPSINKDATSLAHWQEVEARMYESLDAAFAAIAAQAPRRTLFAFVSDHGAKATGSPCNPGRVLVDAGLTVLTEVDDPMAAANFAAYSGRKVVDWSKTRAVANGSCFVWVNLKGRDPDGIVAPEDYSQVQDEIVKALYDHTDPAAGLKPFALALK